MLLEEPAEDKVRFLARVRSRRLLKGETGIWGQYDVPCKRKVISRQWKSTRKQTTQGSCPRTVRSVKSSASIWCNSCYSDCGEL